MLMEGVHQLLDPGYLPMETGYYRLPNGQMHIAVLTRMPGCKGKMVDWWFGYMDNNEKYRMWHPENHLTLEWDEHWRPGNYIGASHLVKQYHGDEIRKGKALFHKPSDFFDTSKFEKAKVGAVICVTATDPGNNVQIAQIIHFVRDTEFGCEMRSRFWHFHGSEQLAAAVMKHCIEEMGYLADFLPQLYARENVNK
jgi:hypothetical protein